MADLSAVLRKTIDGLPNATPELRARVYEKARTAILRQIEGANPPLPENVASARRAALEDAVDRTEEHYLSLEQAGAQDGFEDDGFSQETPDNLPEDVEPAEAAPAMPPQIAINQGRQAAPPNEPPRMPRIDTDFDPAPAIRLGNDRQSVAAPPPRPADRKTDAPAERRDPLLGMRAIEPDGGLGIPDADTSAPRYSAPRARPSGRNRGRLVAGLILVLLVAASTGAYLYQDQLATLTGMGGANQTSTDAASRSPSQGAAATGDVASLPSATTSPDAVPGSDGKTAGAASPTPTVPKRRFNQRLNADGTEVDAGPAVPDSNAFDEGTNIAAATPEANPAAAASDGAAAPPASSAQQSQPNVASSTAPGMPAVGQKAIFYEERTDNEQGSQQAANVVWSLANESPAEGQPPEAAIRGIVSVPGENLKLTMTIRRNLDPTLPASHVVELLFDVPNGFPGGQIANVQRLALKPTEEARGDPLIGVAGKISDGFFVIALNNLDKATQTNLDLLSKQEWIDIPIAYATGRRALLSVDKGIPGNRVFKEAIDAWAAKRT